MKDFTTEDILILGRMGYKMEDVAKMVQVRKQEKEPEPEVKQEINVNDLRSKLDELETLVKNGFISNTTQPEPETAEQILAHIINPPGLVNKKEGDN